MRYLTLAFEVLCSLQPTVPARPSLAQLMPTMQKRQAVSPKIGPGFTDQETQQLPDAFSDATELAHYVFVKAESDLVHKIMEHYFFKDSKEDVRGMSVEAIENIVVS